MGSPDRLSKQEAFLALLGEGWTLLHLDARRDGVIVPERLKGEAHLVLQYGYNNLTIPIPDLRVDEHGVTATLSFARTPHQTVVPWSAVYLVRSVDGRGVLYPEDVPKDVAASVTDAAESSTDPDLPNVPATSELDAGREAQGGPRPRALRAVGLHEGDGPADAALADTGTAPVALGAEEGETLLPVRRRRRPQLRLVK